MIRFLLGVILAAAISASAQAATCYWVGGTGNFDNTNTTSWSSSTGGGAGTCAATGGIPKNTVDVIVFDSLSGGGTVTVCGASSANCPSGAGSLSAASFNMGAFTGTVDFSAIDPNVTMTAQVNLTGTQTKTLNMGDGTWLITGANTVWDCTTCGNLTLNANGSNLTLGGSGVNRGFITGGKTYNTLTLVNSGSGNPYVSVNATPIVNNLVITAPMALSINGTMTVNNAMTLAGASPTSLVVIHSATSTGTATFNVGTNSTCDWCYLSGLTKGGAGSLTTTNSFGIGNTGFTINGPAGGGGGKIIGG
jgi:hypothetical protein